MDKEKILAYKNDFVVNAFLRNYDLPKKEAEDIFQETVKWLYLCSIESSSNRGFNLGIFGGTIIIDEMWHTFILCTKDYFDFCFRYFDKYIHHQPLVSDPSEQDLSIEEKKEKNDKTMKEFKKVMSYVYDHLGEQTTIKWYDTYADKYSSKKIQQFKKNGN